MRTLNNNHYNNYLISVVVATAMMFSTALAAESGLRALPSQGEISFGVEAGTTFDVDGDFVNSTSDSATVGEKFGDFLVVADISGRTISQEFSDVFDQPLVIGLNGSYGLSSSSELFGTFQFTYADSTSFDYIEITAAGTITNPAGKPTIPPIAFAVGDTIRAELDEYFEVGLDVGYRYFFNYGSKFRPFASVQGGLRVVDSMDLNFKGELSALSSEYFDTTLTYSFGLGLGFRYDVSDSIAIGLETGVRYQGDLEDEDDERAGTGFSGVNDDADRLHIPLMFRAEF